jgi:2,4-dienoyl-CoA reductase-like NADH-dependent reductase (Old Yellow Enzyme family)
MGRQLENRARILIEIVRATRARVSPGFGVGVKLNSADFQKGGFDAADAVAVVRLLNAEAVDLVEISGGSYESPAMHGRPQQRQRASTRAREAYFLDFARDIVAVATMPIMVTGGIRRRATAEDALAPEDGRAGVAMVGIAQALAYAPDLPNRGAAPSGPIEVPAGRLEEAPAGGPGHDGDDQAAIAAHGAGQDTPKSNLARAKPLPSRVVSTTASGLTPT